MILMTSFLGTCSAVSFTWLLKQSPMLGMAAGFFLLAILGYLGTLVVLYISEIFHTRIRGTYVGIATTVSRVSNIVLPLGVVALTPLGIGYVRSEEHTSELQSLMRISYAVFCLKKKKIHY